MLILLCNLYIRIIAMKCHSFASSFIFSVVDFVVVGREKSLLCTLYPHNCIIFRTCFVCYFIKTVLEKCFTNLFDFIHEDMLLGVKKLFCENSSLK